MAREAVKPDQPAQISAQDLRKSDQRWIAEMAIECDSSPEQMMINVIGAYIHLLETANFVLPKKAPGVSLAKMGRG